MEILINEKKYVINKLGAIEAFTLQVKVTKLLGSAMGGVGKINAQELSSLMKMEVSDMITKISGVIENLDEDKFTALILSLVSKNIQVIKYANEQEVKVPLKIDDLEILEMYELSFEVLKLNLGKFLEDIKSKFSSLQDSKKIDN